MPVPEMEFPLLQFFLTSGYMRSRDQLSKRAIDGLTTFVDDEFERPTPPYRTNAAGRICRLDNLLERDTLFLSVLRQPAILDPLIALLGPNVEVSKHRHNHATLNQAGDIPYRLHRDIQQWSRAILNVFIYLDYANVENGCTHLIPGSHLLPYAGRQSGDGGGNWADEHTQYKDLIGQEVPVPMPRGGVLFVNSLVFHTVGVNRGHGTRRSLVFACHSTDELIEAGEGESTILVSGQRKFKGNRVLRTSGSLELHDGNDGSEHLDIAG
jgi:ectoine hydroxylase-related dioxygenase (phytanoyl-CoA dioxygenase family)